MRTLVVDALRLLGPRTAMGRYIEQLARHWSRSRGPFDCVELLSPAPAALDGLGTGTPVALRVVRPGRPFLLWEQVVLARAARRVAMLFCPSYVAPLLHGGPLVVANHGIYEALPGEFSRWHRLRTIPLFRSSARKAGRVIANSRATRADLVAHFGIPESRIDVVYPAADERFHAARDPDVVRRAVVAALGEAVPYILFVGKLSRRRNVPSLVEAFARARREAGIPHRLLIIGPCAGGPSVEKVAQRYGVDGVVRHVPHLDQDALAALYAGADLFVLPTVYEGLSWTMLEAMASGAPVLTVPHPTLQEVGGGAVHVAPSAAPQELAGALASVLTDATLRDALAASGRREATRFSWARAASETLEILDRAAAPSDASR